MAKSFAFTFFWAIITLTAWPAFPCDVVHIGTPRTPEGYVRDAEVILRAKARAYASIPAGPSFDDRGEPTPTVVFDVIEVLKGTGIGGELTLRGFLMERDDFNPGTVPYGHARPTSSGPCFADGYRPDREFLLLLVRRRSGEYTVRWSALAPLNEQIRGDNDPWLLWVRGRLQ